MHLDYQGKRFLYYVAKNILLYLILFQCHTDQLVWHSNLPVPDDNPGKRVRENSFDMRLYFYF